MKKMISIILSVLMMFSVFGVVTVSASTTDEKSGNSLNCKWSFNEKSGTLTISGNGKMSITVMMLMTLTVMMIMMMFLRLHLIHHGRIMQLKSRLLL